VWLGKMPHFGSGNKNLMETFLQDGKSMLLAYDQGFEHGPSVDFNSKNVEPSYVMDIAVKGGFCGIVFQKGIAEKYYDGKVPLIVKVNAKTSLPKGEPNSKQNCSVKYAVTSLGARAVGYTIYLGSQFEGDMFKEFGAIQEQAHEMGVAAIAWVYPRGQSISNDASKEIVAYAARVGMELGADAVKIKYTGDSDSFSWAVRSAGRAHVFMSGGPKAPTDQDFLNQVRGVIQAGATGLAVGRNVWQHDDPVQMANYLRQIIFEKKTVESVVRA
jgi:fructose-bisphosphate aldolase, class I